MTLASPYDFTAAQNAAYKAVNRVLGRVIGSRTIEAVHDGFVMTVDVEGYDEPFEVAVGYERNRGWISFLRDDVGNVWAVGGGTRLPEAVSNMGRVGNPKITVKGKMALADGRPLKEAQDDISKENLVILELPAFFFGNGAHILWFLQKPEDIESIKNAPPLFTPSPIALGIIPTFWKQKSAKKLVGAVQFRVTDTKIIVMYMAVQPKYQRNKANSIMIDEIMKTFPDKELQYHKLTNDGREFMKSYGGKEYSTNPRSRSYEDRGDERLRRLERSIRTDPSDEVARHALLAAKARIGDPMAGARISAIEKLGPNADVAAVDAETARIIRTMTADAWRRVPLRNQVKIAQAIIDREFRLAGIGGVEYQGIQPRASVENGKIWLVDDTGQFDETWDESETPASWQAIARRWADGWANQLFQEARNEALAEREEERRLAEEEQRWLEIQDQLSQQALAELKQERDREIREIDEEYRRRSKPQDYF